MTYKNLILNLNESNIDIDLLIRYYEDEFDEEFYDEEEDEYEQDVIDSIFEYSASEYLFAAASSEYETLSEIFGEYFRDNDKSKLFDRNIYDDDDFMKLLIKDKNVTTGDELEYAIDCWGYIIDKNAEKTIDRVLNSVNIDKIPLEMLEYINDYYGIEDFIKNNVEDRPEISKLILSGDIDGDMDEFGKNSDMVALILKDVIDKMSDWDTIEKYSWELRGLLGVDRLKYALDKGTYTKNKRVLIDEVENLMAGKDSGHPFRSYGAQAVQEVFEDYDWSDEELNDMIQDNYKLSKVDFEMPYEMINRDANRKEADHIAAQGPNYRHD